MRTAPLRPFGANPDSTINCRFDGIWRQINRGGSVSTIWWSAIGIGAWLLLSAVIGVWIGRVVAAREAQVQRDEPAAVARPSRIRRLLTRQRR